MTQEQIDERIRKLNREAEVLAASHDATVRNYQQAITNNQNRFQQIRGAISELEYLKTQLNGENNGMPELSAE